MTVITLEEASSNLIEIINGLKPGEEIVITDHGIPLVQMKKPDNQASWPCKAGSAKDKVLWISPDFDAPLDDFEEYM
jgi:antitoxin (DNA-binding transcriptional repressor) of toxin-antitoxin stability system